MNSKQFMLTEQGAIQWLHTRNVVVSPTKQIYPSKFKSPIKCRKERIYDFYKIADRIAFLLDLGYKVVSN